MLAPAIRLAAIGILFAWAKLSFAAPSPPSDLRVNHLSDPVGLGQEIYFGWKLDQPSLQSHFQLLVATSEELLRANKPDVWDSGKSANSKTSFIPLSGYKLNSDDSYFWKVRVWDQDGSVSDYSKASRFATGLLLNEDWENAYWLKRTSSEADQYSYFRKSFSLRGSEIERAIVYVSAVHNYKLYLNSHEVGIGPAYHYPEYQYYNAYDVTSHLNKSSSQQLALQQHWFGGGQGRPASSPGIILKLRIHYSDGSIQEVNTDESWKCQNALAWQTGQAHRNAGEGVGYVERIDSRQLSSNWHEAAFDDSSWPFADVIGPHPSAPWTASLSPDLTRIRERSILAQSITQNEDGSYLVDLGKVYAGRPRISVSGGKAGEVTSIRGGYALSSEGRIDPKLNQTTDLSYYAVQSGEDFIFEPIEYLGLRYLEIEGMPNTPDEDSFQFIVRHSQLDGDASSFESSNATLNAVWELMKHSLTTCAQEAFVDTPTREKGGFLGDAAIQSAMTMLAFNERLLTQRTMKEYLQSMEQHWSSPEVRGRINAVYPNNDGARDIPDYTQAFVPWVWDYYLHTGDSHFLDTNYGKLEDIADYLLRHIDLETGLIRNLTGGAGAYQYGIIDWPASMRFGYDMNTEVRTVINCWAVEDFRVMAKIARELERFGDERHYLNQAEKLSAAINAKLLNEDGIYVDGLLATGEPSVHCSQHASIFPLALGIVPEKAYPKVVAHVKAKKMSVGMVTGRWLMKAIRACREGEHLIDLFTQESWDGWARCLELGATATWESWNSHTGVNESLSHAWGAFGIETYIDSILGIEALETQYRKLRISPLFFGDKLDWAKGYLNTEQGRVSVGWIRSSDQFMIEINLPANTEAVLVIPPENAFSGEAILNGEPATLELIDGRLQSQSLGPGDHRLVIQ